MRLGAILPTVRADGSPLTGDTLSTNARMLERLGFESLWCFDSIGRGFMLPDPLIAVSIAAAVTQRIEVGTCVLQVPLRRPVELAHRLLTTHLTCQGRFLLGVGAGSTKADFDAVGVDFSQRMRLLDEALDVMRRLWRGEQVGPANLQPWPAALGGPPVFIGSWASKQWIERSAQEFAGWIASAAKTSFATLAQGIERFRGAGGRRAIVTNIHVDLTAPTGPLRDDEQFQLRCAPDEAAKRLRRLADLGFDDAVLVTKTPSETHFAAMRALLPR